MELTTESLSDGIARIVLAGRMDAAGANQIDVRFTALTATSAAQIVVDMAQVPFVSSIGIRLLLSSAKALTRRGGRMVIASPQPLVKETFTLARIDTLIPLYGDLESACTALKAPPQSL
jgi:anti-sigma B factor antagonist